jgi:hypothetical protein
MREAPLRRPVTVIGMVIAGFGATASGIKVSSGGRELLSGIDETQGVRFFRT